MEYVFLALEVKIDGTVCNSGFAGDIGYFRIEVAIMSEDTDSCPQDCFMLISDGTTNIV
jgi:hypothetical protein